MENSTMCAAVCTRVRACAYTSERRPRIFTFLMRFYCLLLLLFFLLVYGAGEAGMESTTLPVLDTLKPIIR